MHASPFSRPFARPLAAAVVATVCLLGADSIASAQSRERPVNIVLEDQFRNRRETAQLRGDVVVLVFADRKGAEAAVELGRRLHLRFHPSAAGAAATEWSRQPVTGLPGWPAGAAVPDVHVIPIACVPEVPKPLHAVARSRLRKESEFVSVWLDFDDVMRQSFGMAPAEPNTAIIDTRGLTHSVLTGHLDELRFEEVVGTIDRLRMQARPEVRTAVVPVNGIR